MKIKTRNGHVSLVPESPEEAARLVWLFERFGDYRDLTFKLNTYDDPNSDKIELSLDVESVELNKKARV